MRLADALHDVVVKEPGGDSTRLGFIQPAELVAPAEAGKFQAGFAQRPRPRQNRGRLRVGHGRPIGDFNNRPKPGIELRALRRRLVKRIH